MATQRTDADGDDGRISILQVIRALWGYRRVIVTAVSAAMIGFMLWGLRAYVRQPTERQAALEFRLVFDGADRDEYPNGLPFGRGEIIGTPILTEVYEANEFERYSTYEVFKNALFVLESNPELELLGLEYQSKLADNRISPVDRASLEEEFRQKRAALRVPQYTLNFIHPVGALSIPEQLMSKVLNDVLTEWAEQAATRKGVLRHQVSVFTQNLLLKGFLEADDYVVRLDILRGKINRVITNLDVLEALPGASIVRVGENQISLPEIRVNLEDLVSYRLEPLTGFIWSNGLSRDLGRLGQYLANRQFQLTLDFEEAAGTGRVIEESLRGYLQSTPTRGFGGGEGEGSTTGAPSAGVTALIPQFGDSFLDRIMDMGEQTEDVQFRQELTNRIITARQRMVNLARETAYYGRMNDLMQSAADSRGVDVPDADMMRQVETRFSEIYDAVVEALQESNAIYTELSTQNLNPRTNLFTITSPFSITTQRAITVRTLVPYGLIALVLSLLFVSLACLINYYFPRSIFQASPRRQSYVPPEEEEDGRVEESVEV